MEYRNAVFNKDGTIDVEIKHPIHGWIPFTASSEDTTEFGRSMHSKTKVGAKPHTPKPKQTQPPRSVPDLKAAIQALINGDSVAAQTAMDKMV